MRRLVGLACLALVAGCAGLFATPRRPCLRGPVPQLGELEMDEMYRLLRDEFARSRSASSPLVRAQIYERLPPLIPDASDRVGEPTCAPELIAASDDVIVGKPVRYDRMLVARVRAAGLVGDTTDVMPQKAAFLIAIIKLRDHELTPYQRGPDEQGPPPPRAWLRRLALASLAHSSMYYNVPEAGEFLAERVRTSTDPREQLLLRWSADALMDRHVRDLAIAHPSTDPRAVARTWIAEMPRLVAREPDAVWLELAIVRLEILGKHARSLGVDGELRAVLDDLIARRGEVPLARTIPSAPRDLLRTALGARFDLDYTGRRGATSSMSALRTPYDPRAELEREPAGGRASDAVIAARGAQLDRDLARTTHPPARCALHRERARWVTSRRAGTVFATVGAWRVAKVDRAASCRVTAALSIDGVDASLRANLIATALDEPAPGEAMEIMHRAVAIALQGALELVHRDPTLRRVLVVAAAAPLAGPDHRSEVLFQLQPAFDALLAFHASRFPGADRAAGTAILDAWDGAVREVLQHPAHSIYPWDAAALRVLAMSEWAPLFGREAQTRALLADILGDRYPAAPGAELVLANLKRAATIATGVLGP